MFRVGNSGLVCVVLPKKNAAQRDVLLIVFAGVAASGESQGRCVQLCGLRGVHPVTHASGCAGGRPPDGTRGSWCPLKNCSVFVLCLFLLQTPHETIARLRVNVLCENSGLQCHVGQRTQEAQVGVLLVELGGLEATLLAFPFSLAGLEENAIAVGVCGAGVWGVSQHSSPAWSVSAEQVQSEVLCCLSNSREAGRDWRTLWVALPPRRTLTVFSKHRP